MVFLYVYVWGVILLLCFFRLVEVALGCSGDEGAVIKFFSWRGERDAVIMFSLVGVDAAAWGGRGSA